MMALKSKYVDATYCEDILPNSSVGYPTHLVISNSDVRTSKIYVDYA
jgi:hypothetical protein